MKITSAILILFYLANFQDVSAKIKVLHKSVVHLDKLLVFRMNSYIDGRLTYALCDKDRTADPLKCSVFQEKTPYSDDSYSCEVTFKRVPGQYSSDIELIPFGKHYAVLSLFQGVGPTMNFTTVQFDSCKVGETTLEVKTSSSFYHYGNIVGHSNSFDVFFKNWYYSCLGKTCKAIISADGKLANGPRPSVGNIVSAEGIYKPIVALDDQSSTDAYFYFKDDKDKYLHVLVKSDGTEKVLGEQSSNLYAPVATSTNNKLISVCYPVNREEYKCSQYDYEGNSKLETTITKSNDVLYMFDMYNLPSGGFYTVSRKCENSTPIQYLVERIDTNGKKTGSFEVQGLEGHRCSEYNQVPYFYNNENNETCVSVVVFDSGDSSGPKEGKGHLYLTSNCFTDADFSQ